MRECVYCDTPLSAGPPEQPEKGRRLAYDPLRGRLWEVCSGCERWNPVPLELRWESLEQCERAVRDVGRLLLSTDHLALVRVGRGELVRVGEAPRLEFAGWRYGDRIRRERRQGSFWSRLLDGLPTPPLGGYDPYGLQGMGGIGEQSNVREWTASPFLDRASALTLAFGHVPLAPECPSCGGPLALAPWTFQEIRFVAVERAVRVSTRCALCRTDVACPPGEVRPGLRLGLAIVTAGRQARASAEGAARILDEVGGVDALLRLLGEDRASMGELGTRERVALAMALDEAAEARALEQEWREAEEIAAIMDGELTRVPGFEEFRRRTLQGGG